MNPPRPVRPVGVLLSAVVLGLAALLLLLLALGSFVAVLGGARMTAATATGVAGAPAAGMITAVTLFATLLYLALAAWAITTLIGMVRMRPWARVSAIVMAGCVVGFSLLGAIGTFGAQAMLASGNVPLPPNVTPAMLHKVFVGMAMIAVLIAIAGAGWLVYLTRRSTRDAFLMPGTTLPPYATGSIDGGPSAIPVWSPAPPARNPLTDFTVARPLAPPAEAPPTREEDPQS